MKETNNEIEINDGHYHEMLDRLHVQMGVLEEHVLEHPIGQKHEDVRKLIIRAIVSLVKAYQLTGGLAYEQIKKTKKKETNKRRNSKNNNK